MVDGPKPEDSEQALAPTIKNLRETNKRLRLSRRDLQKKVAITEWIKAIGSLGAVAGLFGIAVTAWLGIEQIKLTRQTQTDQRFDSALKLIASNEPSERLIGVSSLNLFVNGGDNIKQASALTFLVNAISIEKNEVVRQVILNIFNELPPIKADVLQSTLKTCLQQNRALNQLVMQIGSSRNGLDDDAKQKIQGARLDGSPYGLLSAEELGPLEANAWILTALIRRGATDRDLSGIYCESCDFSRDKLVGEIFNDADLRQSNFSFSNLQDSRFVNADIQQADFYRANLRNSILKTDQPGNVLLERTNTRFPFVALPTFECADLRGADLSGRLLAWGRYQAPFYILLMPAFHFVVVDSTTNLQPFNTAFDVILPPAEFKRLKDPPDYLLSKLGPYLDYTTAPVIVKDFPTNAGAHALFLVGAIANQQSPSDANTLFFRELVSTIASEPLGLARLPPVLAQQVSAFHGPFFRHSTSPYMTACVNAPDLTMGIRDIVTAP